MTLKALTPEKIEELTAKTDAFAKKWAEDGYPPLKDEDLKGLYLNVQKYFPDMEKTCYCDGIAIPLDEIYNEEWMTVDDIMALTNIEARRLYISKYGTHRFLRDGGAEPVTEEDSRGYQIVKFPVEDSSWYFLKMLNSTLEKANSGQIRAGMVDGGYTSWGEKIYFLRLPKELVEKGNCTNEDAVAWSFNSKVKPGHIYQNATPEFIEKSKQEGYVFEKDKREFSLQARQGDVHIRLLAESMEDFLNGKMYTKDGYDPDTYCPDVEA